MDSQEFITNQKKLARAVGKTPEHLSAFKNRKAGYSEKFIEDLHKITGIRTYILMKGSKKQLDNEFKNFFTLQRTIKALKS